MKRKVFLSVCLLAIGWGVCSAQDIIVTRDAKKISAKVTEVNVDNIKYKNFDNPDGPTYTILKSQIASILYQNGTVETFEKAAEQVVQPVVVQQPVRPSRSSIRDYPEHYAAYCSGRSMKRTGIFALITGVIATGIGGVTDGSAGVVCFASGVICTGTGITAMVIGGKKKRSAMDSYLMEVSRSRAGNTSHLQLNLHGNGLGLAYVF